MFKRSEDKALAFTFMFAIAGVAAQMVNISKIWGSPGQTFTLFDFFSALPTAFLGLGNGLMAVLIAKLAGVVVLGQPLEIASLVRLALPVAAGAAFFYAYKQREESENAKKSETNATVSKKTSKGEWLNRFVQFAIPLAAIAAFALHPAIFGTIAMAYALWWTIPIAASILPKNLFLRSLGATFNQHAVGSVLYLYFVPGMGNPAIWLALIPVVAIERLVFASGISVSYVCVNKAMAWLEAWTEAPSGHAQAAPAIAKKKGEK